LRERGKKREKIKEGLGVEKLQRFEKASENGSKGESEIDELMC
jgi:hypothetical protein